MLSYRLRWYGLKTARLLRRRWQAIFLALMLLSPAMMPAFAQSRVLGAPVLAPLAPDHGLVWRLAWVHLLEVAGFFWVLLQREAVGGGAFAGYLRSLPYPHWRKRAIDLTLMLVANTPILLPVLAATVALIFTFVPGHSAPYFYLLDLTLITFAIQLAVLARSARYAPLIVLANLGLMAGLQTDHRLQLACFSATTLLALMLLCLAHEPAGQHVPTAAERRPTFPHIGALARLPPPLLQLSIGIAWRRHRAGAIWRGLLLTGWLAAALLLMRIWQFDGRSLPLLLIVQALVALNLGSVYRELAGAHAEAAAYLASLPVSRSALALCDISLVVLWALPFVALLPLVLAARGALPAVTACGEIAAMVPLSVLLRWPQIHAPQQSVWLGAILAALWTAGVWQVFV